MRRPIEKLARLLATESDDSVTFGELATKYNEAAERIADAWCVLKLLRAMDAVDEAPITYIPV
jgi:hypothetical protein